MKPSPWQEHVQYGGAIIEPPRKTIYMATIMPPVPRLVWVVREYEDLAACLTIPPGDWEVDGWGWARSLFYVHNAYLHPYTDTGWRMCQDLAARYEVFKVETEDLIRVMLEKLAVGEE